MRVQSCSIWFGSVTEQAIAVAVEVLSTRALSRLIVLFIVAVIHS